MNIATTHRPRGRLGRSIAAAAAVAVVGLAATGGVAAATGAAAHATGGKVTAYLENDTANGTVNHIIITGAFADYGTSSNSEVHLQKGTFKVDASKLKPAFKANIPACSYQFSETGPVTLSDGTGAYTGISGTLTVKAVGVGIGVRKANGKCNTANNAPDLATEEFITATGTVSFSSGS